MGARTSGSGYPLLWCTNRSLQPFILCSFLQGALAGLLSLRGCGRQNLCLAGRTGGRVLSPLFLTSSLSLSTLKAAGMRFPPAAASKPDGLRQVRKHGPRATTSQRAQRCQTKRKTPLWTTRPKGARVGKGRGSCELASPNAEEGPKGAKATIRERRPMASLRANPTTV